MKLEKVQGLKVDMRAMDGTAVTMLANPQALLLKNGQIAQAKQFKAGDKVIAYYNVPAAPSTQKVLFAVMDPGSEVLLSELRGKPIDATFKAFDPATKKLTAQVGPKTATYTVAPPVMALREMDRATLGMRNTKEKKGYAAGDKVLLIMAAKGKQVRFIMDKMTYGRFAEALKKFPIPPASKAGK